MTPEQRTYHARELRDNPVLAEIIARIEAEAIDVMTFAKPPDHDTRQAAAAELRAIRNFRDAVRTMADPPAMKTRTSVA
jgi:hypothetical protein